MPHAIVSNEKIIPNCPKGWLWLNYLPWLPLLNWTCVCVHGHTHTHTHTHACSQSSPPKLLTQSLGTYSPFQGFGSASEFQTVYSQPVHSLPFPASFWSHLGPERGGGGCQRSHRKPCQATLPPSQDLNSIFSRGLSFYGWMSPGCQMSVF